MTANNSTNTGCLNIHGYIWCLNMYGSIGYLNVHGYIGRLNINGTHVTANNSTDTWLLNVHGNTGYLDVHRAHVTAYNLTNNYVVFFFCFTFENIILLQLLILDHNALDKRRKYILYH